MTHLSMANYKIGLNTVVFEVSYHCQMQQEVGATSGVDNPGASAPDMLSTLYICGCGLQ
jgi:hypothetical protein